MIWCPSASLGLLWLPFGFRRPDSVSLGLLWPPVGLHLPPMGPCGLPSASVGPLGPPVGPCLPPLAFFGLLCFLASFGFQSASFDFFWPPGASRSLTRPPVHESFANISLRFSDSRTRPLSTWVGFMWTPRSQKRPTEADGSRSEATGSQRRPHEAKRSHMKPIEAEWKPHEAD